MTAEILNAFTVDLEDWYHGLTSTNRQPEIWPRLESRVAQNTRRLLDLLAEFNIKATFFVLGRVAERFPGLIKEIEAEGHEIGVHGYDHRKVDQMTPAEFHAELERSLDIIQPLITTAIRGHRAPYFSINGDSLWAGDTLRDLGFQYDSSFFPTRNMLYGYPKAPRFPHRFSRHPATQANGEKELIEFPVSTARFFGVTWPVAGGFYLRALPYSLVSRALRSLNRQGYPTILYMHPWELDTGQPIQVETLRERITHFHGRRGLETKLRRLFQRFKFGRLCDLMEGQQLKTPGGEGQ